ncbi:M14 family metallopeptidase [Acidobacteriota bacterium]
MKRIDLKKVSLYLLCLVVSCLFSFGLERNDSFVLGDIKVAPGEMKGGYVAVPEKDGKGSFLPVTVINGSKEGPVLALVAGIHGYEYPPILSLYRLKTAVDPEMLTGTLILVHIANLPSFQKRTIYYNPFDWKNLNRVFPGDPNGTITQRIAHILKEKVIEKCDFLIDLHCGDGNEALIPYTYWMISGNEKIDNKTKNMTLAFGLKYIIIDKTRTKDISQSKYLGNTAILFSKPAITTESGYLGKTDEESVARNVKGILSVMRLFEMIDGKPEFVSDPVWIDRYEVIFSDVDGLFYPQTKMGYYATEGERIGYITDYLGSVIKDFYAPFTGIMLYIIATPPANKGEPLFEIGRIKRD